MDIYRINIVMRSGQVFNTEVPADKLSSMYKDRDIDFSSPIILDTEDESKNPVFIINGKYVESVTLRKILKV